MDGQPIIPIQVIMPKPLTDVYVAQVTAADQDTATSDSSLFNKIHDYLMSFVPISKNRNDDIMRAANFGASDHVSEDTLLIIRSCFGYALLSNVLTTYLLNSDGIMHMLYFFTYWGIIFTGLQMALATKAVADKKRF